MAAQTLTSLEEYFDLPDQPGIERELLNGTVIELGRPSFVHGATCGRLFITLSSWLQTSSADYFVSQDCEFLLNADTACAPDVLMLARERYERMAVHRGALVGAPDIAIEVVSRNDRADILREKIEAYLEAGTAAVWVLYLKARRLDVHRRSSEGRSFRPGEFVENPELLPGLRVSLDELFAALPQAKSEQGGPS